MYLDFYGLRELPFELTANPEYLYLTPGHREALATLQYGLSAAKAVTVLIGEAGTGKTTVLKAALESERCRRVRGVHLSNAALSRVEFLEALARSLGLGGKASRSKTILLEQLDRALRERRSRGEITALIVDEAQGLSAELLEEIRLLGNIESASEKLLPIVLVGQPGLATCLEDPALRQLKQRVALRCQIAPLLPGETAAYIAHRIEKAGGCAARLFTRDAIAVIHRYAGGIPRTISVICDNALLHGLALERRSIQPDLVLDACADLSLHAAVEEPLRVAAGTGGATTVAPATRWEKPLFAFFGGKRRGSADA